MPGLPVLAPGHLHQGERPWELLQTCFILLRIPCPLGCLQGQGREGKGSPGIADMQEEWIARACCITCASQERDWDTQLSCPCINFQKSCAFGLPGQHVCTAETEKNMQGYVCETLGPDRSEERGGQLVREKEGKESEMIRRGALSSPSHHSSPSITAS